MSNILSSWKHLFNRNQTPSFRFEVIHKSKRSAARVGRIHTPHGVIDTPGFVPVATNATIKGCDNNRLQENGSQLIFCNTYHLLVHPGAETIEKGGGVHKYMNYKRPIITDSGGFQVFSLSQTKRTNELKGNKEVIYDPSVLKITEEGVKFRSYLNGDIINLTPESSVEAQKKYGSDIIIPLDILPGLDTSPKDLRKAFEKTHRWEKRSLNVHLKEKKGQAMYSVIHGDMDLKMREESIKILTSMDFDGHGVGGSLGRNREEMVELLRNIMPSLNETGKPIHLLGVGDIPSIEQTAQFGIDTFDSCFPTKLARHKTLLSRNGPININKHRYKEDFSPIDPECKCTTCRDHSLAFLHHLHKMKEVSFFSLASAHNIRFMMDKMSSIREMILRDEI
eukprot:TRINITY_DN15159_c0_g1_i1.p1 TRINITY_DN15159_c0_g1~~TRINITY_DN15159_c0_g1_i1.p1  ORF type:complete len:394 (+),score=120.40 TRINITY_DN15159_c0_g1_i1:13-1194(+)